jgi:Glycine rich protein
VSKVLVNATGSQGATGSYSGLPARAGYGGWVQALLSVSVGQTLYIYVGSVDFNGGGGAGQWGGIGGGATDIRTISGNLTSRLIVAGGGGGGCSFTSVVRGGNGGAKMSMHLCVYISTNLCLS